MRISRDRSFYGQLTRLAMYIALQNVAACFVGLADNVMIGAYSQDALSGVALANQYQFLLHMIVSGVGEGMAVIAAQYWGTKRLEPIRRVLVIALETALALAMAFFAVAQLAPGAVLGLLAGDAGAVAEGVAYMRIVSFSYVFFCAGMVLTSAQRSVENVRVAMLASLVGLVVNIALNWALIFGNLGMPRMGVRGAAVATLIARATEAGLILAYTLLVDRRFAVRPRDFAKPDRQLWRDFRKVAVPVMLSGASWGVAQGVQTGILGRLGSSAIAANAIANSLFQVVSVVAFGFASASAVVIGKAVGRDDRDSLRGYVGSLQLIFLGVGLLSGGALFLLKDWVLSMYAVTPEATEMARRFMTILSVTLVGTTYQCGCLTGVVRGGGNTKFVFYNDLVFMWGIVLPLSMLAAFAWGWDPALVFLCLKSDQITKCFVAVVEVNSYRWVRKVARDDAALTG